MKQDRNGVRTAQDLERKYDFSSIGDLKKNYELQKQNLNKVENEINSFVKSVTKNIEELQDQVDGNITTWFSNGVPSVDNYPEIDWKSDEDKNNHLGDLYYDKETGYAYRYTLDNDEYLWIKITDTDITKALAIANSAQDTADSKRRVFIIQPDAPYDVGDLWIRDEELYRCQTSRPKEEKFEDNDWIKATKYTDDTYAIQIGEDLIILSGTVTEIKEGVNELSLTMTNINELVNNQGDSLGILSKEVSSLIQSLKEIEMFISEIKDINVSINGVGKLEATVGYESTTAYELKIRKACQIFPSKKIFPSSDIYPLGSYLRITYEDGTYNRYKLPPLALREYNGIYDELFYTNGELTITKKIGITESEELYLLEEEQISTVEVEGFLIKKGKNIIELESFPKALLDMNYMNENEFTETFATKLELESRLRIAISQILLQVSQKLGEELTAAKIILAINNGESEILLDGNKINLNGVVTANENFKILEDGSMVAKNGSFNGNVYLSDGNKVIGGDGLYTNLHYNSIGPYNSWDMLGISYQFISTSPSSQIISYFYNDVTLLFQVPNDFVVEHAYLTLLTTPVYSNDGTKDVVGKPNKLRLYKADTLTTSAMHNYNYSEIYYDDVASQLTEIDSAFGIKDYTPGNAKPGSIDTKTSVDLKNYITVGQVNSFVVRTNVTKPSNTSIGNDPNLSVTANNTGVGKLILDIYGYMKTKN